MALTKLRLCPFCDASPTLEDHRTMWMVRCSCGASMLGERAPEPETEMPAEYWQRFEQSAIDRWNRRTVEPGAPHVPTWKERCQTHPDHTDGAIVSSRMIELRMQEEIDDLRSALNRTPNTSTGE